MTALPSQLALVADALCRGSGEAVVLVASDGTAHVVAGGESVWHALGRRPEALVVDPLGVIPSEDAGRLRQIFQRVLRTPGESVKTTFWVHHEQGHLVAVEATASNHTDIRDVGCVVVRLRLPDATDSWRPLALESSAPSEPESWRSTGMIPTTMFMEHVQRVIAVKERKIWSAPRHARGVVKDRRYDYALVRLEIDRFKALVASVGKGTVDRLVLEVGVRLGALTRGRDKLTHLGDGDFAVLLDGVGDIEAAHRVIDGFTDALERPCEVDGMRFAVSPVFGIATSERRYELADELLRDAAMALSHAARRRGRRRRAAYQTAIRREDTERIQLMADLRRALDSGEFYLRYQPIVELPSQRLTGFEALARWRHPSRGEIPPDRFIAIAEEAGSIHALGAWVCDQACGQLAGWQRKFPEQNLTVAVNVSPTEVLGGDLRTTVTRTLERHRLPARSLSLEITEGLVIESTQTAREVLSALRADGVRLSLDDFGTGYASLSYLAKLPYDVVKIDRSFLNFTRGENQSIVSAIVTLAHGMRRRVVAEGVEDDNQLAFLYDVGCDAAQGYLFAKPLLPDEATLLIGRQ